MKKILFYIILTSLFHSISAQEITSPIRKDSLSFSEAISILEKNNNARIFYKTEWIKIPTLERGILEKPFIKALNHLAKSNHLAYFFLDESTILFTKDYAIKSNYAKSYHEYLKTNITKNTDTIEYAPLPRANLEKTLINKEYKTYNIGSPSANKNKKTATINGVVKDIETGESLVGTVVYIDKIQKGSVSNAYGAYTLTVPKGQYKIEYRSLGMRTTHRNVNIYSDGVLNIELKSKPTSINEITVKATADDKVKNLEMGVEKISIKSLKRMPSGFGEADIIKGTLLLPGVQAVSEASAGFNVRGGSSDQNLVLLNETPIMNTSHFFGFFSGFNADLVKDVTLYKSGVPAKYGGRASSVMDITLKDGNRKQTKISGGISPVSGRLVVDGPIKKDKSSFILGARSTYSNWVLKLLDDVKLKNSNANFHDLQGNFSFDLNDKNSLYISGYYSHDDFDYHQEEGFSYNTLASSIKWHKTFSPKLFSSFSANMSQYNYNMSSNVKPTTYNEVKYKLNQYSIKTDFTYHTASNHKIDFGLNSTWYDLSPGERTPFGEESTILPEKLEDERAIETSLYLSDQFNLTHFLSVSAGIRFTTYANFGPKTQFNYTNDQPLHTENITDTTTYKSGDLVLFYSNPEFRLSANFALSNRSSIKLGVSRMHQYIQMISNTATISPTDIWKLSDQYLKPLRSDQYSIGFYQKIGEKYEFTAETYYKKLDNIIDYKGGAKLVMNEHLETDIINGDGKAYGVELMMEKKMGKFTGWVNYTYSRILHKSSTPFKQEEINNGDYYPANYDKPHDFKLTANYKAGRRVNLSSSFMYSSGRPFTAPIAYYKFKNSIRPYYTERNALRMEDYMRWDIAATLHGNLIRKKMNHSSWTFAVYNVLGRKNPYSVFFRSEGGKVKGYQMSIYGQPIFTVTYNFKLRGNAKDDF
ncbi:TonB-dependent receptor [Labilibacter marinus]|uniref:TonB-dependent receptor n=1 Tax=Labilibacter marinus TaxID=1477105 RepID=UPI0009F97EB6|nr:carboxypeptidase-like regulatory domain-containing protein [Labilibacter marinus]